MTIENRLRKQLTQLATAIILIAMLSGAAVSQSDFLQGVPTSDGEWLVPSPRTGRTVTEPIRVDITRVGVFMIDPTGGSTIRPDIIQTDHFSVFDLIVQLGARGDIDLEFHYDEAMATHVIDSVNGDSGWWYEAHYDNGWFEDNSQRMDTYLVKNGTAVRLFRERSSRLSTLYGEFETEVERLKANDDVVIIPRVTIGGSRRDVLRFENVEVTAHDTRLDLVQPGTITALDILLSLGEQGSITELGVLWYDAIFSADPVDHYFVEYLVADGFEERAHGSCGFVYETGYSSLAGFAGAHIHIPTDARVIVSPEYALWFWICL